MEFDPIGIGCLTDLKAARLCVCVINGFGCGTKIMRTVCTCEVNGCGCGWGNPGSG